MKLLMIGSGGREHAMSWKLAQSSQVEKVFVAPGNDGMTLTPKVELLSLNIKDHKIILDKVKELGIELVVVGPEQPLADGLVDFLEDNNVLAFGPSREAAQLEASKVFSKKFMNEFEIPTARSKEYNSYDQALADLENWDLNKGIALKADELAGGKGVVVTHDVEEAKKTLYDFMENPECTVKTKSILIEEKLVGKEASAFAICDGEDFIEVGYACDYKRVRDNDEGPNTGGMGGYSPKNWPGEKCRKIVTEKIIKKTIDGMKQRGTPFKGILFVGLMIDGDTPNVIEFNVRFGDPETQILMPLIDGDLLPTYLAAAKGELKSLGQEKISLKKDSSVHIVMASEGYPSTDATPMTLKQDITYPTNFIPGESSNKYLFMAGVKKENDKLVNTGGRVLGVTALASTLEEARNEAYRAIKDIKFNGAHWRGDIAKV
jgi:phosphoribosylamine--glycine ligase